MGTIGRMDADVSAESELDAATLERLYREYGPGLSDAELRRKAVPLGSLWVVPEVFQPRDPDEEPWRKEQHIETLAEVVRRERSKRLDPILVWAAAGRLYVVDGHCRVEAYRKAGLRESARIPVRFVRGDLMDALTAALGENSKDKLPLTKSEKTEAAWRLVLLDETRGRTLGVKRLARLSGVSRETIRLMRTKYLDPDPATFKVDPRTLSWKEVRRLGTAEWTEDREDWKEEQARAWAQVLRKAFGPKPERLPDVLFRAVEIAYTNQYEQWVEEIRSQAECFDLFGDEDESVEADDAYRPEDF